MLDTVFGLPLHPLIVHATVVVVPLAALSVLLRRSGRASGGGPGGARPHWPSPPSCWLR